MFVDGSESFLFDRAAAVPPRRHIAATPPPHRRHIAATPLPRRCCRYVAAAQLGLGAPQPSEAAAMLAHSEARGLNEFKKTTQMSFKQKTFSFQMIAHFYDRTTISTNHTTLKARNLS